MFHDLLFEIENHFQLNQRKYNFHDLTQQNTANWVDQSFLLTVLPYAPQVKCGHATFAIDWIIRNGILLPKLF